MRCSPGRSRVRDKRAIEARIVHPPPDGMRLEPLGGRSAWIRWSVAASGAAGGARSHIRRVEDHRHPVVQRPQLRIRRRREQRAGFPGSRRRGSRQLSHNPAIAKHPASAARCDAAWRRRDPPPTAYKPSAGTRQRRLRKAVRKAGFSASVSTRALIMRLPIVGSLAQLGIKPQRRGMQTRRPLSGSLEIVAIDCEGAMLKRQREQRRLAQAELPGDLVRCRGEREASAHACAGSSPAPGTAWPHGRKPARAPRRAARFSTRHVGNGSSMQATRQRGGSCAGIPPCADPARRAHASCSASRSGFSPRYDRMPSFRSHAVALIAAATLAPGCVYYGDTSRDVDRTPIVDTGVGATVLMPGQSAPSFPGGAGTSGGVESSRPGQASGGYSGSSSGAPSSGGGLTMIGGTRVDEVTHASSHEEPDLARVPDASLRRGGGALRRRGGRGQGRTEARARGAARRPPRPQARREAPCGDLRPAP